MTRNDVPSSEIGRRIKDGDPPVEVRFIPGPDIHVRVMGFVTGGFPILHPEDASKLDEWHDSLYKCHWCMDGRRVYLHGEQRLPPEERLKEKGSPCPVCVRHFTAADWWKQCEAAGNVPPVHTAVAALRGAIHAYLHGVFPPRCSENDFEKIVDKIGPIIAFNKQALTFRWYEFADAPGSGDGRLCLVDDQGRQALPARKRR